MRARTALVTALVAVMASACDGGSPNDPTRESADALAADAGAKAYVEAVNEICAAHRPRVLDATGGGHDGHYPIASFRSEAPTLTSLTADFDSKVAAVEVRGRAHLVEGVLNEYRNTSDAARKHLAAAAATGDQATFDAAYDESRKALAAPSENLTAAGFSADCTSR